MTNDVEQLFMCIFVIDVCSFEISVTIFCLFYSKLFVFLLLNFENSLYIQDTSPILDTYFVNIFSQPITCLSIVFHGFLQKADIFNF